MNHHALFLYLPQQVGISGSFSWLCIECGKDLRRPYGTPGLDLAANPALKCWAKMRRASGAGVCGEREERGYIERGAGKRIRPFEGASPNKPHGTARWYRTAQSMR